jgi:hypothetical protein
MFDGKMLTLFSDTLPTIADLLSSERESISPFFTGLNVLVSPEPQMLEVLSKLSRAQKITGVFVAGCLSATLTPPLRKCLFSFPISSLSLTGGTLLGAVGGDFDSITDLASMIHGFPALEFFRARELYLRHLPHPESEEETEEEEEEEKEEEETTVIAPPPSGLRELWLEGSSWCRIAQWLVSLKEEDLPPIQVLRVELGRQDERENGEDLAKLIRRLGPTLVSLTLTAHPLEDGFRTQCICE